VSGKRKSGAKKGVFVVSDYVFAMFIAAPFVAFSCALAASLSRPSESAVPPATQGRWFSSQFTVGMPVNYPDWLAPDHLTIYYRVSVAF
jgi:hypothetical protein